MKKIRIIRGSYKMRGIDLDVSGMVFPLVKGYKIGTLGGYITVDGTPVPGFPSRNIKICVPSDHCYENADAPVMKIPEESDQQIMERLRIRFQMLEDMTQACRNGDIRAMIISGPPGVGKSSGVERVLCATQKESNRFEVVKGVMSALGLYMKLFEYSERDSVIVFDDCDSILLDDVSLNILKAALDTKKVRTINWNTDNKMLASEGIPNSFQFKGSVIFITNMKFDNVKSPKLRDHLEALESRCHYIDLAIDTEREKMLRIKQITHDGMLDSYGLGESVVNKIVDFIDDNKQKLRELSLRTVLKVADLAKAFPTRWEVMAENTVMRR